MNKSRVEGHRSKASSLDEVEDAGCERLGGKLSESELEELTSQGRRAFELDAPERKRVLGGLVAKGLKWDVLCGDMTLMASALGRERTDIACELAELGYPMSSKLKRDMIAISAIKGPLELDRVLALGFVVDAADGKGDTALIGCAGHKANLKTLEHLLERGASPASRGWLGRTTLHWAACSGNEDSVRLLADAGADIDALSSSGDTPLILASNQGCPEVVAELLALGADPKRAGKSGLTALDRAREQGHESCVSVLLEDQAGRERLELDGAANPIEGKRDEAVAAPSRSRKAAL